MEPLTVPGTLTSLSAIRDYVVAAAEAAGLDKRVSYRLALAVDEIATNIVVHGYDEAGLNGEVNVNALIDDASLTITLEDTAGAFNPIDSPSPDGLDQPHLPARVTNHVAAIHAKRKGEPRGHIWAGSGSPSHCARTSLLRTHGE